MFLTVVAFATAAATAIVWLTAAETGKSRAAKSLDDELHVLSRSVESEIERFRYLPAVVGRDGRIREALEAGSALALQAADRYLARVRSDSHADELYIMRPDGLTVAASNYAEPSSFVGTNYRFRPYFRNAVATGEGRYYAVGVTTGKPGYFLASAIRDDSRLIGVAVVKVKMLDIEQAWRRSSTIAALADPDGVIFLSSEPDWKYRPLHRLNGATLSDIAYTRKYDGVRLDGAKPLFPNTNGLPHEAAIPGLDGHYLITDRAIEPDGWRLIGARRLGPIYANAHLFGMLTILVGLLVCATGIYLNQRHQIVQAKLDEHDRLERRVRERTGELNREIEDRKRVEENLREAQAGLIQTAKLAALGRMSTAIVHEVSQPLSALENTLATAGLLAERGDAEAVGSKMSSARALVRRIRRTVKLLRSFARKENAARDAVSVERSISAAVELANHRAEREGVHLDITQPDPALTVMASAIRLEQVILNLLVNALDAVRETPEPVIAITARQIDDHVEIAVTDNGPGIPPDLRERIAEPFFTTKETGEGLGLGLSISRAIVAEFEGALTFSSEEGGGSTFTIALPATGVLQEAAE